MKWSKIDTEMAVNMIRDGKTYDDISKILNRPKKSIKVKLQRLTENYKKYNKKENVIKKCPTCDRTISNSNNKFCNHSCSATYNNKNREKFNIQTKEKIKNSIKKYNKSIGNNLCDEKVCRSCDTLIGCKKRFYCEKCDNFKRYRTLFKKLGIIDNNLKKANDLAIDILTDLYFNQKLSLIEIRNKFNIMLNTVHFFFKKNGIDLRDLSDSISLSIEQGKRKIITNPIYKQGWHTTWNGKKVYYHSSYELDYAKELDENRLDYDIEFLRIKYLDTQKNKIRIAIPDFYLPESNTIVEIKSNYTFNEQNLNDKFKKYKELGYNVKLILEHVEVDLWDYKKSITKNPE